METFDTMAKDFDNERRIKRSKMFADEIRMHITDGHCKKALEYGCGTGLVGFNLIRDFESIIFIDSSVNMIEQVKQKLLKLDKTPSYALCCDFLTDIPQDLTVDYIFASLVLHHIKDVKTILSRFYSILRNDGHLLVVDKVAIDGCVPEDPTESDVHNGFKLDELTELTKEVGFVQVESKNFCYGSKAVNGIFILDAVR